MAASSTELSAAGGYAKAAAITAWKVYKRKMEDEGAVYCLDCEMFASCTDALPLAYDGVFTVGVFLCQSLTALVFLRGVLRRPAGRV